MISQLVSDRVRIQIQPKHYIQGYAEVIMGANQADQKEKERVGKVHIEDVTSELSLKGESLPRSKKKSIPEQKKKCQKTQNKDRT